MEDTQRRSGCLKIGCVGCLGIFGLAIGVMLLLGAVQLFAGREPGESQERRVERVLPPPASVESLRAEGVLEGEELPLGEAPLPVELPAGTVGRLELDLTMGDFFVTAGEPGTPIEIDADYDPATFELVESFEEAEDGWVYRVRFDARGSMLGLMLRGGGEGSENRVEIRVPRDQPIDLVGTVGLGEGTLDLGGLWLREVHLDLGTGEHEVTFEEPGPTPVRRFELNKGVGELRVEELGNASPAVVDIEQRIGALDVALEGDWRNDAEVTIACGIGECAVDLPRDVRVELDDAGMTIGERRVDLPDHDDLPADAPTLRLRVSGSIGELRID